MFHDNASCFALARAEADEQAANAKGLFGTPNLNSQIWLFDARTTKFETSKSEIRSSVRLSPKLVSNLVSNLVSTLEARFLVPGGAFANRERYGEVPTLKSGGPHRSW